MNNRVIVLGGSGMLGSMVVDYLARQEDVQLTATVRTESLLSRCGERLADVEWKFLDVNNLVELRSVTKGFDWIINAVGITKPLIRDDPASIERAIWVNAIVPHKLAIYALARNQRILQIATDCVFSGRKGRYIESDPHDPLDVYGKTKSLGEVHADAVSHLRCSIIGPELKAPKFLLGWFLGQLERATITGFSNHFWNGITTLHFAKICLGVIRGDLGLPRIQHIVPSDIVTKYKMLMSFASAFKREDILIDDKSAPCGINRTLETEQEETNQRLWMGADYEMLPTIPQMINELADYSSKLHDQGRAI